MALSNLLNDPATPEAEKEKILPRLKVLGEMLYGKDKNSLGSQYLEIVQKIRKSPSSLKKEQANHSNFEDREKRLEELRAKIRPVKLPPDFKPLTRDEANERED